MERTTRMLYAVAGILLLVGVALRIAPAPLESGQEPIVRATRPGPASQERSRDTAGAEVAIVGGNIFSVSRSAPQVRYSPPDLAPTREPARRVPRPATAGLRLFGTVSGTAALIDANPAIPGAEIYQVGEVVAGKRIVAVTESTVVLDGSTGRAVLRLQPPPQPTR
jgi:hypothetical protein